MDTLSQLIVKISREPDALSDDDCAALRRAVRDCPASAVAAALLLKYADTRLQPDERAALRRRVALLGGDRDRLIAAIDPSGLGFDDFYPPEPEVRKPATDRAIETFLETYGHRSPEEDALLERMIFNPVPDYAETLARTEPVAVNHAAPRSQDSLIDAFLAANPAPDLPSDLPGEIPVHGASPAPKTAPAPEATRRDHRSEPAADGLLSESLAKIFIKQGRYDRAYEIISNLNLNYPEKSVYFADQLRFLRKLMINQSFAPGAQVQKKE